MRYIYKGFIVIQVNTNDLIVHRVLRGKGPGYHYQRESKKDCENWVDNRIAMRAARQELEA